MELRVETPPLITGQAEDKIEGIYRYLFRLAEMLNTTGSLTAANSGESTDYTALRSLIINAEKTLNDAIAAVRNEAGSNAASIATLTESVNTAAGNIAALQTAMETANGNISALQSSMGTANGNITALQAAMETANTNIGALQTSLGTLESSVSALEARVTALENKGGTT